MSISRISEIMTASIITVREDEPLANVIELFEHSMISGAPVVDGEGKYVGVISKTNIASSQLVELIRSGRTLDNILARELMTRTTLMSVSHSDPIDSAIELMDKHQVHRVFVTDDNQQLVGIVSTLDVVSRMRYAYESYL